MKPKNNVIKWEHGKVAVKRRGKVECYYITGSKLGSNLNPKNWNISNMDVQRLFDGPDCYTWRKTFALWPVKTIGGKYIWFKPIYKQRFWAVWGKGFHMEPEVEYAELIDILHDL